MSEMKNCTYAVLNKKLLNQHVNIWHLIGHHARLLLTFTWFYKNPRMAEIH